MDHIKRHQSEQKAKIAGLYGIEKSETNDLEKGGEGSGKYHHHKMMAAYHEAMDKEHWDRYEDGKGNRDPHVAADAEKHRKESLKHSMLHSEHSAKAGSSKGQEFRKPTHEEALAYGAKHAKKTKKEKSEEYDIVKSHTEIVKSQIANIYGGETFEKGGVGSGRQIGSTANGKAVYHASADSDHYKKFTATNHREAAGVHRKAGSKEIAEHHDKIAASMDKKKEF